MNLFSSERARISPKPIDLPSTTGGILGTFARNAFWLWVDRGILSVGTLITGLLLVRYLGPSEYGVYSVAMSVGIFVSSIADMGMARYAERVVSTRPDDGQVIMSTSLFFALIVLVPATITFSCSIILRQTAVACISAAVIVGNLQRIGNVTSALMNAELRSKAILIGSLFGRLGTILVVLFVIVRHLSIVSLFVGMSVLGGVVVCVRLWQVRSHWPTAPDWKASTYGLTVKKAWPYFSYSLSEIAYSQLAVVTFALVASHEKVGWFSAALVISSVFPQWTFATSDALVPVMTRLYEQNRIAELLAIRDQLLELLLVVSIPVAIILSIFAPTVCSILGAKYVSSAPVLRVLAIAALFSVLEGLGGAFLTGIDCVTERRTALIQSVAVITVLCAVLGWYLGPIGAAVAVLAARLTILRRYLFACSKAGLSIHWTGPLFGIGAAGAAMTFVCCVLLGMLPWPLVIPPAVITYIGVLYIFTRHRLTGSWNTVRECIGTRGSI